MSKDVNTGRMGFIDCVQSSFAFLGTIGYAVREQTETMVLYVSNDVIIKIYHGHLSYQLGLEVQHKNHDEYYNLFEILSVYAPEYATAMRQYDNEGALREAITQLAKIVQRRCKALLSGDMEAFQTLSDYAREHRSRFTRDAQYGAIIDEADSLWEAKEYKSACTMYRRAEAYLDSTRVRRLQYLMDHGYSDSI